VDLISIQSDRFIILGNVCSFSTKPDSAVQPYSEILPRVKRVHKFVLNNVCF
jgi:hypothetical protein